MLDTRFFCRKCACFVLILVWYGAKLKSSFWNMMGYICMENEMAYNLVLYEANLTAVSIKRNCSRNRLPVKGHFGFIKHPWIMVEVVVPVFSSQPHFLRHAFFSPFSFLSILGFPTLQRWRLQFYWNLVRDCVISWSVPDKRLIFFGIFRAVETSWNFIGCLCLSYFAVIRPSPFFFSV